MTQSTVSNFSYSQSKRRHQDCKMSATPKTFKIVQKKSYSSSQDGRFERPNGSWETPIWDKGKLIGYWLMYQFDPDFQDYEDDLPKGKERFRPA